AARRRARRRGRTWRWSWDWPFVADGAARRRRPRSGPGAMDPTAPRDGTRTGPRTAGYAAVGM
ncbi:hypothetical protein DKP78_24655, partial [Enterococcus faecium]